jgi:hypothetical protein
MVDFVLNTNRQKSRSIDGKALAFPIQSRHHDSLCAFNLVVKARNREAAFFVNGGTFLANDLWIDEHAQLVLFYGDIDHHQAL